VRFRKNPTGLMRDLGGSLVTIERSVGEQFDVKGEIP